MNNFNRTSLHTNSAVRTLIIVYRSVEILNRNCSGRTFLLTDLTTDTAIFTAQLCLFSVGSRRTENVDMLYHRLYGYKSVRTYRSALSACSAERRNNFATPSIILTASCSQTAAQSPKPIHPYLQAPFPP